MAEHTGCEVRAHGLAQGDHSPRHTRWHEGWVCHNLDAAWKPAWAAVNNGSPRPQPSGSTGQDAWSLH